MIGSLRLAVNGAGLVLVAIFPTDRIDSPAVGVQADCALDKQPWSFASKV